MSFAAVELGRWVVPWRVRFLGDHEGGLESFCLLSQWKS